MATEPRVHTPAMRATPVVEMVVIALVVAGCTGSGLTAPPTHVGSPTPSAISTPAVASPPVATLASASPVGAAGPSPSAGRYGYAHYPAVQYPAGTYATTTFQPAFVAEIDTDIGIHYGGDESGFVFIGADKNASENADEEWDAMYLDRVLDPVGQRTIEPLKGDPLDWFEHHPRLSVVPESSATLEVDRHHARQVDLLPADPVQCGSSHPNLECVLVGYGPPGDEPFVLFAGSRFRLVVVDDVAVPGGRLASIVFAYQAADDERFAKRSGVFDRWIRSIDFQ